MKSEKAIQAIQTNFGAKILGRIQKGDLGSNRVDFAGLKTLGRYVKDDIKDIELDRQFIELLIDVDPTPKSIYFNWIMNMYLREEFKRIEDIWKAKEPLAQYEQLKPKLDIDKRDIGHFKSYKDFANFMDQFKTVDTRSNNQKERDKEAAFFEKKGRGATLYYDTDKYKIVIPHTKAASIYFGKNTRWCTAAKGDGNYFSHYNVDGKLYIILEKKTNKRWQFHFESGQYMDELDDEVEESVLKKLLPLFDRKDLLKYAATNEDSYQEVDLIEYLGKLTPEESQYLITCDPERIQSMKNISEADQITALTSKVSVMAYLTNPSKSAIDYALKKHRLVLKDGSITKSERLLSAAFKRDPSIGRFLEGDYKPYMIDGVIRAIFNYNSRNKHKLNDTSVLVELLRGMELNSEEFMTVHDLLMKTVSGESTWSVEQRFNHFLGNISGGLIILDVNTLSMEMFEKVIKSHYHIYSRLKNPNIEHQKMLIRQHPNQAMAYIENPSEEIVNYCIERNPNVIFYMARYAKNRKFKPTTAQLELAIKAETDLNFISNLNNHGWATDELNMTLIEKHPQGIFNVPNPTPNLIIAALKSDITILNNLGSNLIAHKVQQYLIDNMTKEQAKTLDKIAVRNRNWHSHQYRSGAEEWLQREVYPALRERFNITMPPHDLDNGTLEGLKADSAQGKKFKKAYEKIRELVKTKQHSSIKNDHWYDIENALYDVHYRSEYIKTILTHIREENLAAKALKDAETPDEEKKSKKKKKGSKAVVQAVRTIPMPHDNVFMNFDQSMFMGLSSNHFNQHFNNQVQKLLMNEPVANNDDSDVETAKHFHIGE